jgi:hypothetical protein
MESEKHWQEQHIDIEPAGVGAKESCRNVLLTYESLLLHPSCSFDPSEP